MPAPPPRPPGDPGRRRRLTRPPPPGGRRWPPCARPAPPTGIVALETVVAQVKPTILIGTSTAHGAFTRQVVETMSAGTERPVIFPISNPTSQIESMPADGVATKEDDDLVQAVQDAMWQAVYRDLAEG